MAARTKGDFLNYAKRSRTSSPSKRDNGHATSYNEGPTNLSDNVWGTDAANDEPVESINGRSEAEQRADSWVTSSEQTGDGGESGYYQGDSGRDSEWDTSFSGDFEPDGGYDISIRNDIDNSYQPSPAISTTSGGGGTKRVSFFDNLVGRATKKTKPAPKPISSTVRKVLTLAEVSRYRPGLIKLLLFSSDHMDDGITAITKGHKPVMIWSDLEYADCEILADTFLDAGQKSAAIAEKVRQVMELEKRIKVGVILAPRIYKTIVYTVVTGISFQM